MAVPTSSLPDVLPKESPKSSSQTPSPVTNKASELVAADDIPPTSAIPILNGTAQLMPAANININLLNDTHSPELSQSLEPKLSADSAAGTTAGTGQSPASPSLPTTEAAASFAHTLTPSQQTPREPLHENQKDKNGDKPVDPSLSPPASQKFSSVPSRREGTTKTSPAANHSNGDSKPKDSTSGSRSPKPSFLSKLLRVLVPCVSPSPDAHPIELNVSPSLSASKEKDISNSVNHVVETKPPIVPPTTTTTTTPPISSTSEPVTVSTPDSTPAVTSTPPLAEGELLLPPTPPTVPQLLPHAETEGLTSGAVQPPGSTGGNPLNEKTHSRDSTVPSHASEGDDSEGTSFTEDEDMDGLDDEDDEDKLIMNGGVGIPIGPDGVPKPLLPPLSPHHAGRKCLILDLDETLVHSSFKSIQQADYVVPVEIEYHWHNVYVIKRPGVDNFLKKMGEIYEIVVFTASLSKYADPVLDKLDIHQVVSHRLFRESCYNHKGNYVKDLSQLGRPIADTIILDNSPASYIFHPNNAVPVSSWFNDPHDTELTDLIPFLADLATVDDIRGVLDGAR